MEGTVKAVFEKFGFVRRDGQADNNDLFFSFSDLPSGSKVTTGDRLSFDEIASGKDKTGKDKTKATNIKVISSIKSKKTSFTANWTFSDAKKTSLGLAVFLVVTIKRNGQLASGVPIKSLKINGGEVSDGTYRTDEYGTASFPIDLQGTTDCFLALTVGEEGEQATFTQIWTAPEPKKEHGAKLEADEVPTLTIDETKLGEGRYRFAFGLFNSKGQGVSGKLIFSPGLEVEYKYGEVAEKKAQSFPVEIPADGRLICEIKTEHPRTEIDIWVSGYDRKYQLMLIGPKVKKEPAKKGAGFLAHLTNDWE